MSSVMAGRAARFTRDEAAFLGSGEGAAVALAVSAVTVGGTVTGSAGTAVEAGAFARAGGFVEEPLEVVEAGVRRLAMRFVS